MKRLILILAALGAAALLLTPLYFSAQTAARQRAEEELKTATRETLEARAKVEPTNGRLFLALGTARATAGDASGAMAALTQATTLEPKSEEAALARIALHRKFNDEAGAYAFVTEFLKNNPDSVNVRVERVMLLAAAGSHLKAIDEGVKVVEMRPNDAKLWRLLSVEYLAARQPKAAEETLARATALAPDDWRSQLLLGDARAQQGRFSEAIPAYEAAAKLAPDEGPVQAGLGAARLSDAKTDAQVNAAIPPLKKAIDLLPKAPKPRVDLALASLRVGKIAEAQSLLEEAARLAPFIPEIPLRLSRLYRQQGNIAAADREQKRFEKRRDYAMKRDRLIGEQQNRGYSPQRQAEIARLCFANDDVDAAIRHYRFLADDPEFGAEARDALQRLASLKNFTLSP